MYFISGFQSRYTSLQGLQFDSILFTSSQIYGIQFYYECDTVAYLAYLVRGASSGIDPFFGWGGGGVKVRKMANFSARFARKVAISNFSRKARGKNENCVCLVVFLC